MKVNRRIFASAFLGSQFSEENVETLWGKCEQKQAEKFAGKLRSLTFAVRPKKQGLVLH
jgi:hypothetical protein